MAVPLDEPRSNRSDAPEPPTSFEASLAQLSELVARLESGGLGLSESIDAYERGVAILRGLHAELAAAEERVSVLVRIDEEGRPILAAHGTAAAAPAATADASPEPPARQPRAGRAKPSRPRSLPGMDDAAAASD